MKTHGLSDRQNDMRLLLLDQISKRIVVRVLGTYAVLLLLYKILKTLRGFRRRRKFFNKCQGIDDFSWLYGNLHRYPIPFEERAVVELEWMKRFPKYYRIWVGPLVPIIRVYHPDTLRGILKTAEPKPRGFGGSYETFLPWLGEGLLIAGGQRWARSRRLLTPAFHFDILKPYVNIANEAIDIMVTKIDKHVEAGSSFDLIEMISLCMFDVLHRCAMSVNDDIQLRGNKHPYVSAVNELLDLGVSRNMTPLYHFNLIYALSAHGRRFKKCCAYVHRYAENMIEKRRQELIVEGPPKSRYLDFLDILLSAKDGDGQGLTLLEIRNEVDTFLFEGYDTTTSGITWMLHTLATRPDIQTRVQEELDGLLGNREDKHIKWDDLPRLDYLNRCIKEGMRFHTPVPNVSRRLDKAMDIDGTVFPAGTIIALAVWNVHHNPDVWKDPDVYDPDRFLPENIKKKDPYAYIPFSAGPRNCIGQHFALNEEKVTIGRILQRYQLTPDLSHKVGRHALAVMKSTDGLWVYAKHR